jgi:hypothetical protein
MRVMAICPNCEREQLEIKINQSAYTGLVWSVSQRCHGCNNYAIEIDGRGFIEEPWRSVVTMMEGVWFLRIKREDLTAKLIKSFKEYVDLSIQQLQQMRLEDMPIVFHGTKFEVNFLSGIVSELGIEIFTEIESL